MRFLADVMLAKPARWLRMFGYDTLIAKEPQPDNELIDIARNEERILITRDKTIAEKTRGGKAVATLYLNERQPEKQLEEIVKTLKLKITFPDNTRCPQCNGTLDVTERNDKVPEGVRSDTYWQCTNCNKMYWKGSHWDKIMKVIEKIS